MVGDGINDAPALTARMSVLPLAPVRMLRLTPLTLC